MALPLPTVHLNGTSAEDLFAELANALGAARALVKAMPRPHGRDYPEGSASYSAAREAYEAHHKMIHNLISELEVVAMHVAASRK